MPTQKMTVRSRARRPQATGIPAGMTPGMSPASSMSYYLTSEDGLVHVQISGPISQLRTLHGLADTVTSEIGAV